MGQPIADEPSLRDRIRARLASRHLPILTGDAWAGQARGDHRCAGCHRAIRVHEIEYEPRDQVALYAHVECFTVWLVESRLAAGTAPAAGKDAVDAPPQLRATG